MSAAVLPIGARAARFTAAQLREARAQAEAAGQRAISTLEEASGLAPMHPGPGEAGGEDEAVPRREVEVADVEEAASLGPVAVAEACPRPIIPDPAGDLLAMGEVEDEVGNLAGRLLDRGRSIGGAAGHTLTESGGGEVREVRHVVEVVQVPLHVGEDEAEVVRLQGQPVLQLLVRDGDALADPVVDPLDAVQDIIQAG